MYIRIFNTLNMETDFKNRIKELSLRAESRNIYTYTDFLSPSARREIETMPEGRNAYFFGGSEIAERTIARFGNESEFGYTEEFPIKLLKIKPKSLKFSGTLCHRDFLGSLLGLGIERDKVGDIFVNNNTAFVFIAETLADFIIKELTGVGRETVTVSVEESLPYEFYPKIKETIINVSSLRLDAIIARLYNLPRETAQEMLKNSKVFADGILLQKPFYEPKEGDVIAVRGFGKFVFNSVEGSSSKGRLFVKVTVYI